MGAGSGQRRGRRAVRSQRARLRVSRGITGLFLSGRAPGPLSEMEFGLSLFDMSEAVRPKHPSQAIIPSVFGSELDL